MPGDEERLTLEAAARRSIEVSGRGAPYSDQEWNEAKRNLLELFRILARLDERNEERAGEDKK